jgi:hypothetical protein
MPRPWGGVGRGHPSRTLETYAAYYNAVRTHLSLDKGAPTARRSLKVGGIVAIPILGGLIIIMFEFELLTKDSGQAASDFPNQFEAA